VKLNTLAERCVSAKHSSLFVSTTRWVVRLGDFDIQDPSDDLYVQVTKLFSSSYFDIRYFPYNFFATRFNILLQ